MNLRKTVLIIAIALVAVSAASAQDARVKKALDSLGVKYEVNDSGNYKVVYQMENDPDRSQLALVVSKTNTYKSTEIREIWSIAAVLDYYPDQELIERLFTTNSNSKLGAWAIEVTDDGQVWIIYTAKVQASITAKQLTEVIYFVCESADELELELLGTDEY